MKTLSLAEADDIANRWADQKRTSDLDSARCSYFDDADREDLVRYWKTGYGPTGGKLTQFEFGALVEAWARVFGCAPPSKDG